MRIPGINVFTVRNLLDLGFREAHELAGRSPEALFEELRGTKPNLPKDLLYALRMAVYYSETIDANPEKMKIWAWRD